VIYHDQPDKPDWRQKSMVEVALYIAVFVKVILAGNQPSFDYEFMLGREPAIQSQKVKVTHKVQGPNNVYSVF
jgi:hypothetical protein